MRTKLVRLLFALGLIVCSALPAVAGESGLPLIAGADAVGGYAGDVLVKLLPVWQPPAGTSGVVTIDLRIGSDGRPLYCEASRKSGNTALDESACQAVVRAGSFPPPPYGAITEVFLTFVAGQDAFKVQPAEQANAPKERGYAEEIMFRAKPYIQVPQGAHGEFSVELTLRVNETGGVEQIAVSRSSGRADVDNAVLTGVIRQGVIPPRPAGSDPMTMRLLFTLKSN